jgi:carboxyl-terminal processing protease
MKDLLPLLQVRHEMRISKDKEFQFLLDDIKEFNVQRDKKLISLNETERRKERDARELKTKEREKSLLDNKLASKDKAGKIDKAADKPASQDDGLQANERSLTAELAAEKARKDAKDILLDEAAHILGDAVDLVKSNHKLAERVISSFNRKNSETRQ